MTGREQYLFVHVEHTLLIGTHTFCLWPYKWKLQHDKGYTQDALKIGFMKRVAARLFDAV